MSRAARSGWFIAGLALLAALFAASVSLGVRDVSLADIVAALSGQADTVGEAAVVKRLPRTVLAMLVGAALALSGAALQAITRNPLADPGILGISAGSSFFVVLGITLFQLSRPYSVMGVAIAGAAVASILVYLIGSAGRGGATPLKLALSGAAMSAALVSLTSAAILPRVDAAQSFQSWQVGGVGGGTWDRIATVAPILAVGALICFACSRGMNSLALGDDLAVGLGEHVGRTRALAGVGAVVLCGAATAIAGPIGFVGLIIPHLCRLLFGPDHRWLLPFSALAGASLLVAADVIGRVIARPDEIQVGIITAIIGAPFFIWIVRRQRVREL
ncbi:ABC transporter permease [Leucobacter sp. Psy1]|uniref:FecCD family ABC transporter permease n=1 Tax=Leucobacter sp. Psy1 TaxID=2875729 RepID=UPI001CD29409|nr:iron ABC transporter permease [Leucobacter sp. Psy1]UBH04887.1 ABC transporter permease [Leucobacter sp. Psy1]